jgi:hypothetical protein
MASNIEAEGVTLGSTSQIEDDVGSIEDQLSTGVSAANSSTSTLNASATFTGTWVDVSTYTSITVAVKTDQDGSFTIQFSPDGVNADSTLTRYYRTGQIEAPHRFTITRQYARVTFTNDSASNQTYFRLQTILGNQIDLNAPMDSTLAQDFDAVCVRPTDFHTEVALGRRQGQETWNKFGYNLDLGTAGTQKVIAEFSAGALSYITTAETMDIVSSSANDTNSSGTGARSVRIWGVGANWVNQTEDITLNGTSTVTTTKTWIGINRVSVTLAGSGAKNDGKLTVTGNTTTGTTFATVPASQGTTQQCIFYVPAGYQFLAEWLYLSARKTSGGAKPEIDYFGYVYSAVSNAEYEIYRDTIDIGVQQHIDVTPPTPFVVGEQSILWFTAESDTNNTSVKGRFSGELVRDADA